MSSIDSVMVENRLFPPSAEVVRQGRVRAAAWQRTARSPTFPTRTVEGVSPSLSGRSEHGRRGCSPD
jgi:hypothetical protein